MFKKFSLLLAMALIGHLPSMAQNLPSLMLNRNINSTFSITAYDSQAKEWGIAVATNNIYVGNSTCYVVPGLGAFSCIAETEPGYASNGFAQLKAGKNIRDAVLYTKQMDADSDTRQVAGIDSNGNTYAFTGSTIKYWKGHAATLGGKYYMVMGNQLAPNVLPDMAATFEHTGGTLAERLLAALIAGENAGGQLTGKQSAALLVKGTHDEWFNQVDLRVDNSRDPFGDLQRLLDYHYGRITLNQANYELNNGNRQRAEMLLQKAVLQTKGWYGLYPRIAKVYLSLGRTNEAIALIKSAVNGEPEWKENLSAFYCLYDDLTISRLYPVGKFSLADWNNAISTLIDLDRLQESLALSKKVLLKYPSSSYTWYLQAKSYQQLNNKPDGLRADSLALKFDPENAGARKLLSAFQ